jgi:hypothetical protein
MHVNRISEVLSNHGEPTCQSLKSLSFTALPKTGNDPVQTRRAKLVSKLEEQKLLLKDPAHVRTVQRWVKVDARGRPPPNSRRSGPGGRPIPPAR